MVNLSDVTESLEQDHMVTNEEETSSVTTTETTPTPTSVTTGILQKTSSDKVKPSLPAPVAIPSNGISGDEVKLATLNQTRASYTSTEMVNIPSLAKTTAPISDDVYVEKMKALLEIFKNNNAAILGNKATAATTKTSITALASVIALIMEKPNYPVLNAVYQFFKENVGSPCMDPLYTLQGIMDLDKERRLMISSTVQLFRQITQTPSKPINYDLIRSIFQRSGDAVMQFLARIGVA